MNDNELYVSACNLYDGGWRKEDYKLLRNSYKLSSHNAKKICDYLSEIETHDKEIEEENET
jgi:hypothetical protein